MSSGGSSVRRGCISSSASIAASSICNFRLWASAMSDFLRCRITMGEVKPAMMTVRIKQAAIASNVRLALW